MSIRGKLLIYCSIILCVLAVAALSSTAIVKAADVEDRKLSGDLISIAGAQPVDINVGEVSPGRSPQTVCTGDWMGTPRYALNNWFIGREYYATYQDPTETGCPLGMTYPYQVDTLKWHVYNPLATTLNINIQAVVWDADYVTPTCPMPGEVVCYSPMYNVTLPAGPGGILISLPMNAGCCIPGPYFAGVYCPDSTGPGLMGVVTDSAGNGGTFGASRTCANYNNYQGFHEDLITAYGFPGNLRLWTIGTAADVNTCDECANYIEPGIDLWTTPPGHSFDDHFTATPIPPNFFGPGSDPFQGTICLQGDPLLTNPAGLFGFTDCIIERNAPAMLPGVGSNDVVPIEIVALNLVSCNPITVTYPSSPSQLWDVRVVLSSNQPQQIGQMDIRRECCNGGTFTSNLPVTPKFIFTEVGSPTNERILDLGGMMPPIMFQTSNGYWSYDIPAPFDLETSPGLVTVDHDLSPVLPDLVLPPSSKFTPGFRTLPCEPSSPNDPYCGGKVLTLEQEALAQHGVLPPQETTPIEGACCLPDNSCVVTDPTCCLQQGGVYQGDFVPCTPTLCIPNPVFDSICTFANLIVTISPSDITCSSPEPPISLSEFPGGKTIVRRSHPGPYSPGEIIDIELVQLNLTSIHPTLGTVNFTESPTLSSMGRITVNTVDGSGNLTSGDSFFDVFFEVDLPSLGRAMRNQNPVHMEATLTELPPLPPTTFTKAPGAPELLLDIPGGFPVGFLCDALHQVVSCDCCIGVRGDPNGDGAESNVLDLTFTVDRIFRGGPPAACAKEGDPNGDNTSLNILDLTYFVDRIFRGGPQAVPCI
jgi:hypothetical protein